MSALAALLQLSSATLPVGAYSYSQGLESAVETGHVRDERTARDWIAMVLAEGMTPCEAVIVAQALAALTCADVERLRAVNMQFLATRETRELLAETLQMGRSMRLLVAATPGVEATVQDALLRLEADGGIAYPIAWAVAAAARDLDAHTALTGYLYAALENLVLAAVKIVPLGQNAGQRLLSEMGARVDAWAEQARTLPLAAMTNFLPGQILASMHHEHQHTRLFRS
jgi:urease accessory protein